MNSISRRTSFALVLCCLCCLICIQEHPQLDADNRFLGFDFESTDDLDAFFNAAAVNFGPCSDTFPLIPSGFAEIDSGELLLTNSSVFGINVLVLRPELVPPNFPESREYAIRLRFNFTSEPCLAHQLSVAVKVRTGIDEDRLELIGELERSYSISVFPDDADVDFIDGAISLAEFGSCHSLQPHPEWPGAAETGFALVEPGEIRIARDGWYWLDIETRGNEDGGPVTIAVRVWPVADDPGGDNPPAEPQLSATDPNGLPLDDATRTPESENQVGITVSLDYPDPSAFTREPGAMLRVDDISVRDFLPGRSVPRFIRGDSDANSAINITDAVFVLNFLFTAGDTPPCKDAADSNGDNRLNLADGVFILNHLFLAGEDPPAPGTSCGEDPDEDTFEECVYGHCP